MSSKQEKIRIGIFGFGNMGRAIFELLKKRSPLSSPTEFFASAQGTPNVKGIKRAKDLKKLAEICDVVFLCIKPQDFYALEPIGSPSVRCIFISIMAGVKIKNIAKSTGSPKIIRAMPNLPLQIGEGVIGWMANGKHLKPSELKLVRNLFDALGYDFQVKNENLLDAVTAISGSGPAYVFLFQKALARSAKNLGLDSKTAEKVAAETIKGSMNYYLRSGKTADELIKAVKSKKGTTEAALDELDTEKFIKLWKRATKKAYLRSRELSSRAG